MLRNQATKQSNMKVLLSLLKSHYVMLIVFLAPIHPVMYTTVFIVMADLVVGIWAAIKRGETISSRKMSKSVSKVLLYNLALITSFVVEKYMLPELPLVRLASGFIAAVEVESFFENINTITGVNLWDAVKAWFKRNEETPKG